MGKLGGIFITATDTGAGKTVIAGFLARFFSENGFSVVTQKWVETGSSVFSRDVLRHLKIIGRRKVEFGPFIPHMSPYVFSHPSSPHLASRLEGKKIDLEKIKKSYNRLSRNFDVVLAEGAGGVLTPINDDKTMLDFATELDLPLLIVAVNRLGAINQALLAIEAAKKRSLRVLGVLFNRMERKTTAEIARENMKAVERFGGVKVLGELRYSADTDRLYRQFGPIGEKILAAMEKNG